jgi:hypothetical protein
VSANESAQSSARAALVFLIMARVPFPFMTFWRGGGVPLVGVRTGERKYNRDLMRGKKIENGEDRAG